MHSAIIVTILAIIFGLTDCNQNSKINQSPTSATPENQSLLSTDNVTSQPQNATSENDENDVTRIDIEKNTVTELENESDPLTDIVIKADIIALGIITDKRTEIVTKVSENYTSKFAYTLYTFSIDKVIKGNPSIKEATIREEGGYIGDGIYQYSAGIWNFWISDHVLLGLLHKNADDYILFAAPYGGKILEDGVNSVLWIQGSATSRDSLESIMGRICKILRINGIPNSLNEPCPEPVNEPVSPPKQHPTII